MHIGNNRFSPPIENLSWYLLKWFAYFGVLVWYGKVQSQIFWDIKYLKIATGYVLLFRELEQRLFVSRFLCRIARKNYLFLQYYLALNLFWLITSHWWYERHYIFKPAPILFFFLKPLGPWHITLIKKQCK